MRDTGLDGWDGWGSSWVDDDDATLARFNSLEYLLQLTFTSLIHIPAVATILSSLLPNFFG